MEKTITRPKSVTIDQVMHTEEINAWIAKADFYLGQVGYTEHGQRHCRLTSKIAFNILERTGRSERLCELAAIAAYMHDIGNAINRRFHAQTGALLAYNLLSQIGMPSTRRLTSPPPSAIMTIWTLSPYPILPPPLSLPTNQTCIPRACVPCSN